MDQINYLDEFLEENQKHPNSWDKLPDFLKKCIRSIVFLCIMALVVYCFIKYLTLYATAQSQ